MDSKAFRSISLVVFGIVGLGIVGLALAGCGGGGGSPGATNEAPVPGLVVSGGTHVVGEPFVLDAARSRDPDGDRLSFEWSLAGSPVGSAIPPRGLGLTASRIEFTPDAPGNFVFRVHVGDGRATADGDITVGVLASNVTLVFEEPPKLGQATTVSLDLGRNPTQGTRISWELELPDGSRSPLPSSSGGRVVALTCNDPGVHSIEATLDIAGAAATKSAVFRVAEEFPYDPQKVEAEVPGTPPSEAIGVIRNQVFILSSVLSEAELRGIVGEHPELQALGYDPLYGLLVEFDDSVDSALAAVEALRFEEGVDSVYRRVHEGPDAPREDRVPNDGSAFDDGGDNWQLEEIGAVPAWDTTIGSTDFVIGISDGGFFSAHEDLEGRFAQLLTTAEATHGTSCAGAIGANTDNSRGISGINWRNRLVGGLMGQEGLWAVLGDVDGLPVLAVNSSWSIPGYIPSSFNPTDPAQVELRSRRAIETTRPYRNAMLGEFSGRLFVWSAGNGVGNGASSSGFYGIDSSLHSGAAHLDDDGNLDLLPNLIVTAAMGLDGRLAYYSNFGEVVDIAAPTSFRSTRSITRGQEYGTFGGTSAAAPVVTGAASIIFSVYPRFTPADVKEILIESATESVTERRVAPTGDAVEDLARPIPVLDLEAAVALALQKVGQGLAVRSSFPDPVSPLVRLDLEIQEDLYRLVRADWTLEAWDNPDGPWFVQERASTQSPTATLRLHPHQIRFRATARVRLQRRNNDEQFDVEAQHLFHVNNVIMLAERYGTDTKLQGVSVRIEKVFGAPEMEPATVRTDSRGLASAWLERGRYRLTASHPAFHQSVRFVTFDDRVWRPGTVFFMTPRVEEKKGAIKGFVSDVVGLPLAGVTIEAIDGEGSGAIAASATSDDQGFYLLEGIPLAEANLYAYGRIDLLAHGLGVRPSLKRNVLVLADKTLVQNFVLLRAPVPEFHSESGQLSHPLFSPAAGDVWTFRGTGTYEGYRRTMEFLDGGQVGGASTLLLRVAIDRGGDGIEESYWLAQDAEGNVWILGTGGAPSQGAATLAPHIFLPASMEPGTVDTAFDGRHLRQLRVRDRADFAGHANAARVRKIVDLNDDGAFEGSFTGPDDMDDMYLLEGIGILAETLNDDGETNGWERETSPPATGRVRGTVLDALSRDPLAGVEVSLLLDGRRFSVATSGAAGDYELAGLPDGDYLLRFAKDGYLPAEGPVQVRNGETTFFPQILYVDVAHAGAGRVEGRVIDSVTGGSLPGATLRLRRGYNAPLGEIGAETTSDANARYALEAEAGYYTLEASREGYLTSWLSITLVGGHVVSQETSLTPRVTTGEVRIVLSWGSSPRDLDSHLAKKTGGVVEWHVYFHTRTAPNQEAVLDRDDTDAFGPETITLGEAREGATYVYYVHDFTNHSSQSSNALGRSQATVTVYTAEGRRDFNVPDEPGTAWKVFEIRDGVIVPLNQMLYLPSSGTVPGVARGPLAGDELLFQELPAKARE